MSATDAEVYLQKHLGIKMLRGVDDEVQVERASTGLLGLDLALGGGLALGRVVELWGQTGLGKTSLVLHWIAQWQRRNWPVFFADLEHTIDPHLFDVHNVDPEKINFLVGAVEDEPMWGEDLLTAFKTLPPFHPHALFVVDSVPALIPKSSIPSKDPDGIFNGPMASTARLLSTGLKWLVGSGVLSNHKATLVLINQVRTTFTQYGSSSQPTGGEATRFFASHRLEVRRGQVYENDQKQQVGHELAVNLRKNKSGGAYTTVILPLVYDMGFHVGLDAVNVALQLGLVEKKGSWWSWEGDRVKGQGQEKFLQALQEDPALWINFYQAVREAMTQALGGIEVIP